MHMPCTDPLPTRCRLKGQPSPPSSTLMLYSVKCLLVRRIIASQKTKMSHSINSLNKRAKQLWSRTCAASTRGLKAAAEGEDDEKREQEEMLGETNGQTLFVRQHLSGLPTCHAPYIYISMLTEWMSEVAGRLCYLIPHHITPHMSIK